MALAKKYNKNFRLIFSDTIFMSLRRFSIFTFIAVAVTVNARVTTIDSIALNPGKAGGIYYAYPITNNSQVHFTSPPKGYKPFYVSHYGRHGSRYLISDEDYLKIVLLLQEADSQNALTCLGKELKSQIDTIYEEARGRGGELTPLGAKQHREIAKRLISNNPEIFSGNPEITAKSTVVMRCAHSMFAFCEGLKEINPTLQIPRESAQRDMGYLNYHTPESNFFSGHQGDWYQLWRKFRLEKTKPERLVNSIFSDSDFVAKRVDPIEFMWDLYWVTVDLQNMETSIRLYNLFTAEELFNLWQVFNFNFYACNSSYPYAEGTLTDNAKNLLENILTTAQQYISEDKNGATLRFGHDGNIIPLTALLQLDDCYTYIGDPHLLSNHYADYAISPMASNLQIIFYKNKKTDDILVKFLLNEKEIGINGVESQMFPFYKWHDIETRLRYLIETPSKNFITTK